MKELKLDILAIGAHPDDVELGCGATLASLAAAGRQIGIVHLTGGEMGTRGSAEERRAEAEKAAQALGASAMEILDCGDGGLRTGAAEEDALIQVLRRYRPEIVLGPAPEDRHPDHGRSYRLVKDACFYAGLLRRGEGEPHRPGAVFSYMQHDLFQPSFIVDVSSFWDRKTEALAAYSSQLYQKSDGRDEPVTKVATKQFAQAVHGRGRHFGVLIGADYGEAFFSPGPLAVGDPMQLVPGGVR